MKTNDMPVKSIRKNKNKGGFAFLLVVTTMMLVAVLILGVMITTNNAFFSTLSTIDTEEATYLARAITQDVAEKISKKAPDIDNQFGDANNFLSYKANELNKLDRNVISDYSLLFDVDNSDVSAFRAVAQDMVGITTMKEMPNAVARWMVVPVVPMEEVAEITRFNVVTEVIQVTDKEARALSSGELSSWEKISYYFNVNRGIVVGRSELSMSRIYGLDDYEASKDIEQFLSNYPINIIYGNPSEYDEATKTYLNNYTTPKFENGEQNSRMVYFYAESGKTLKVLIYPLYEGAAGNEIVHTMGVATISGSVHAVGNNKPGISLQYLSEGFNGIGSLKLQNTKIIAENILEIKDGQIKRPLGKNAIYIDGTLDISNLEAGSHTNSDGTISQIYAQTQPNYIEGKISATGVGSSIRIRGSSTLRTKVVGDIVSQGNIYLENVDVIGNVVSTNGSVTIVDTTVDGYVRSGEGATNVLDSMGSFKGASVIVANNSKISGGIISQSSSVAIMGNVWVGAAGIGGANSDKGSIFCGTDLYITKYGYNTAYNNGLGSVKGESIASTDGALAGVFTCGGSMQVGRVSDTGDVKGDLVLEGATVSNPSQYYFAPDGSLQISPIKNKVIKISGKIKIIGAVLTTFGKEIANATDFAYEKDVSGKNTGSGSFASDSAFYNMTISNNTVVGAAGNAIEVVKPTTGNHKIYANILVSNGKVTMQANTSIYKLTTPHFEAVTDGGISSSVVERLQVFNSGLFQLNSTMTIGTIIVGSAGEGGSTISSYHDITLVNLTVDRVYGYNVNLSSVKTNEAVNANRLNGLGRNTGVGTSGMTNPPTANTAKNGLIAAGKDNEGKITLTDCSISADMAANTVICTRSQISNMSRTYLEPDSKNAGGSFIMDSASNKKYSGAFPKFSSFGPDLMLPIRDRASFGGTNLTLNNEVTLRTSYGFGAINAEDGGSVNFGEYWNILDNGNIAFENGNFRTFGNWAILDEVPGNVSVSGNLKLYERACYNASPIDGKPIGIYAGGYVQIYCNSGSANLQTSASTSFNGSYSGLGNNFKGTIYAGKGIQIIGADGNTKLIIEGNVILGDASQSFGAGNSAFSVLENVNILGNIEHRGADKMKMINSVLGGTLYTKAGVTITDTIIKGSITHTYKSELDSTTESERSAKGLVTISSASANGTGLYYVGGDITTALAVQIRNYDIRGNIRANGWNNDVGMADANSYGIDIAGSKSSADKELYARKGGIKIGGKSLTEKFLVNNIFAEQNIILNKFVQVSDSHSKAVGKDTVTTGITSQKGYFSIGEQLSSNNDIVLGMTKIVAKTNIGGSSSFQTNSSSYTVNSNASIDIYNASGRGISILSNYSGTNSSPASRPNNNVRIVSGDLVITGSMTGDIYLDNGKLTVTSETNYGVTIWGNITAQRFESKNAVIGKAVGGSEYNTTAQLTAVRNKLHIIGVTTQIKSTVFHSECNFVGGMKSDLTSGDLYEISSTDSAKTFFLGRLTIGKGYKSATVAASDTPTNIRTRGHIVIGNAATIVGNLYTNCYVDSSGVWRSSGTNIGIDFDSSLGGARNRFTVSIEGNYYYYGSIWVYSQIFVSGSLTAQYIESEGAAKDECSIKISGQIYVGGTSVIRKVDLSTPADAMYMVKGKTFAHGPAGNAANYTRLTDIFAFNDIDLANAVLDGALILGMLTSSGQVTLGEKIMLRGDFVIDRDLTINGYGRDVGELTARNIFIVSTSSNRRQIGVWKVTAMENMYVVRNAPTKNPDGTYNFEVGEDVFWNYRANGPQTDVGGDGQGNGGFNVRGSSAYKPNVAETEGKANIRVYGNAILGRNFKAQNKTVLWVGGGQDGKTPGYLLYDYGFRMWCVYVDGHVGGKVNFESLDRGWNNLTWNGNDHSQKQAGIVKSLVVTGTAIIMGPYGYSIQNYRLAPIGLSNGGNDCRFVVGGNRKGLSGSGEGALADKNYPYAIDTWYTRGRSGEKNIENIIASFTSSPILSTVAQSCTGRCLNNNPYATTKGCTCGTATSGGTYVCGIENIYIYCNINIQGSLFMRNTLYSPEAAQYNMYIGDESGSTDDNFYMEMSAVGAPESYDSWAYWEPNKDTGYNYIANEGSEFSNWGIGLIVEGNVKYVRSQINTQLYRWGHQNGVDGYIKLYHRYWGEQIGGEWGRYREKNWGVAWWQGEAGLDYNGQSTPKWNQRGSWYDFWNNNGKYDEWLRDRINSKHKYLGTTFYDDIKPLKTDSRAIAVFGGSCEFAEVISGWYKISDMSTVKSTEVTEAGDAKNISKIIWQNGRTADINGYTVGSKIFRITINEYLGFHPLTYKNTQLSEPPVINTPFTPSTLTARPTFSLGDLLGIGIFTNDEAGNEEGKDDTISVEKSLKPYNFKDPIKVNKDLANPCSYDDLNVRDSKTLLINTSGILDLDKLGAPFVDIVNKKYTFGSSIESFSILFNTMGKDMHVILKQGYSIELDGPQSEVTVLGTGRVFIYAYPGSNFIVKNGSEVGRVDENCTLANGGFQNCHTLDSSNHGYYNCVDCEHYCEKCRVVSGFILDEHGLADKKPLCGGSFDGCGYVSTWAWDKNENRPCGDCQIFCRTQCMACKGKDICIKTHLGKPCPHSKDDTLTKLYFVGLPIVDEDGKPTSKTLPDGTVLNENTPILLSFGNGIKINAFFYLNSNRNSRAEYFASDEVGAKKNIFTGSVLANDIIFYTNSRGATYTFASRKADLTFVDYGNGLDHAIDPPDDYDKKNNDKWGVDYIK